MIDGHFPQPPTREDYSGEVQQYEIFNGQKKEMTCHAALSQHTVQVPVEVQALSISAVTLYGASPLAVVPLRHSGTQILNTKYRIKPV